MRINSHEEMMQYMESLNTKRPVPTKIKTLTVKRRHLTDNARSALTLFLIVGGAMSFLFIACKLIENG